MQQGDAPQILANRFRIESALAEGGMGSVYVATDLSIGRRVAIKMLHPEIAVERDNLERLREEAFSLATLHHPNIVQLFDFVAGGPQSSFLVMELVDGVNLAAALMRQPMLPVEVAVDYAQQVLSALAAAHAKGIVHRDIKPANLIIVSLPARRDLVKVLDFGIAKLTEATIRRRPTTAGVLLGTPTYMTPEQAAGGGAIDARTDVYAMGLVLYRMLSGINPFEGFDLATTLHRITSYVPAELARFRGDVPDHVARAVMRALQKDPNMRFANAVDFAQALGLGNLTANAVSMPAPAAPAPPGQDLHTVTFPPPQQGLPSGVPIAQGGGQSMGQGVAAATAPLPANAMRAGASDRLSMPMGHVERRPPGATPPPTSSGGQGGGKSFVFGALAALAAVAIIGLSAIVIWLVTKDRTTTANAANAPAVDAGVPTPVLAPSTASAPDAATSAKPVAPSGATSGAAAGKQLSPFGSELGGNCRCLPVQGNFAHGNNQRLAPKPSPMECSCEDESGATVCKQKFVDGSCPSKFAFTSTLGASCSGFDSTNKAVTGKIKDCQYSTSVDLYAGPAGRSCKGLSHDQKVLVGEVFCPRR